MTYRQDIDGLRSIAVMLVVLNHAGFSFFSGGYVGVDVFFVISGFLITGIIHQGINQDSFSIPWFLGRRIKRLMPALFVVIAVSVVVFSLLLMPRDLLRFYWSVIAVILYGGNFFFWKAHGTYFAENTQEAPLLHTWSLAVEEQYYFIWPIMLIVAFKFFRLKGVLWLSGLGCIAAVIFSEWGTQTTVGAAYYLLPTRFFELLVGSTLALAWGVLPSVGTTGKHVLGTLGITLVVGSSLLLTEHSSFPGYNAVYPVLGTALLIFCHGSWVNRAFENRVAIFVGNISYSLYLWHWPVFVVLRYSNTELTLPVQLGGIALSFVLAYFSWRFVEQPFRTMKLSSFKDISIRLYVLPTVLIGGIAAAGIYADGLPQRFDANIVAMENAVNSRPDEWRGSCHSTARDYADQINPACVFGAAPVGKLEAGEASTGGAEVLLFGDSHANHFAPLLDSFSQDAGVAAQDYTMDGCLPVYDYAEGFNAYKENRCIERNKLTRAAVQAGNYKFVILAGAWPYFGEKSTQDEITNFKTALENTITHIEQTGATVIFIEDVPTLGAVDAKCPLKKALFKPELDCTIARSRNTVVSEIAAEMNAKHPSIRMVNPSNLFCDDQSCNFVLDSIPLYKDGDHLNEDGARLLGKRYLQTYGNPLK